MTDFDIWRSSLRDSMVAIDATPLGATGRADYTGWVYMLPLGRISVADVGSAPVRVSRTRHLIAADAADIYQLSIARRASWARQGERPIRLRAGDAVLFDATQPSSVTTDGFGHQVVVNVPRADLRRRASVEHGMLGQAIRADTPGLRVLIAIIDQLGRDSSRLTVDLMDELGHTTTELLASTLRATAAGRQNMADPLLSRTAQLARMRDFVGRHLADPDLSPRTLADAFGVSLRYVESAFRVIGQSPARFIRETRLDEARRMLADPRQRHRSIGAVGRSVGMANPSVFSRAFRGHYDISPREYRDSSIPPGS